MWSLSYCGGEASVEEKPVWMEVKIVWRRSQCGGEASVEVKLVWS